MMENIQKQIDQFDSSILNHKEEIKRLKAEKEKFVEEKEQIIILDKIRRYEERFPEGSLYNIECLVLTDETYEDYYERIGSKCVGASSKDTKDHWKVRIRNDYNKGGLNADTNYVKWLIKVNDKRLEGKKIGKVLKWRH